MRALLRNRWVRWLVLPPLVLLVALALAGFIAFHVSRATGGAMRDKVVAELDATDPNWRIHDLTAARNAKLPPAEENAAVLATRAHEKLPPAYYEWNNKSETGRWLDELKLPRLPHAEDVADFRDHLKLGLEAVEQARNIRHVRSGGLAHSFQEPDVTSTSTEPQQRLRRTAALLSQDALVSAYDRNGNDAIDSCHAILAVARGIGDDPTDTTQLIRIATVAVAVRSTERTLAWCDTFDDAKLAALQAAFAAEAQEPHLWYALRGERAIFYRVCENIDSGASTACNQLPAFRNPLSSALQRATIPDQQAVGLKMFTRLIAEVKAPAGPARTAAVTQLVIECERLTGLDLRSDGIFICGRSDGKTGPNLLLGLLLPDVYKLNKADTRTVATLQVAQVALACERHRLKTGSFPAKLEDLPKELLAEVPTDPFTGKPILFKLTVDELVVYCTGSDGTDDGGDLKSESKPGFDVGVRLFHPQHRRQPPVETP